MKVRLAHLLFTALVVCVLSGSKGVAQDSQLKFSVLHNGRSFADLKAEDIRIVSKSGPLQPARFSYVADSPLSVLILMDVSASQERVLPTGKGAAEYFADRALVPGKDRLGIVTFSDKPSLVQDLTSDLAAAKSKLRSVQFEPPPVHAPGQIIIVPRGSTPPKPTPTQAGYTSLFESVHKVVSAFQAIDAKGGRKVILLISDGFNTSGERILKEVVEAAIKADILIYAFGVGDDFFDGIDKKSLERITERTGGSFAVVKEKKSALDLIIGEFHASLRGYYSVTLPIAGKELVPVKIEIVNPALKRYQIKAPESYF